MIGAARRRVLALALAAAAAFVAGGCAAPASPEARTGGWPRSAWLCERRHAPDALQQDRRLRFAAIVRAQLDAADPQAALISRSGVDLTRFDIRLSHSGVVLRDDDGAWAVRQLYYACDEGRPRLYDQGVGGFLFNSDEPSGGTVSIVLLPPQAARSLAEVAGDRRRATRLLAAQYSANAYPFSVRYQNCNQWVIELIAAALGDLPDGDDLRARAQAWLADRGYRPSTVAIDSHLLKLAGGFVPLLHFDDHPDDGRYGLRVRTSLPASIEGFLREQMPAARRIELCHDLQRVVIREGWTPIAPGCRPARGDRVVRLD